MLSNPRYYNTFSIKRFLVNWWYDSWNLNNALFRQFSVVFWPKCFILPVFVNTINSPCWNVISTTDNILSIMALIASFKLFVVLQVLALTLSSPTVVADQPHDLISRPKAVVVQGSVYCKSCKYIGNETLEGATPLEG